MTYGKIFEYGTGKESQYGHRFTQGIRLSYRDGNHSVSSLWDLETAGVPVRKRGRDCRQSNSNTRQKNCLHRQAFRKSYSGNSPVCPIQGPKFKRSSHRGYRSLTLQRSREWQSQRKRREQSSLNIVLTDCQGTESAKHTSFLFLIKVGASASVRIV